MQRLKLRATLFAAGLCVAATGGTGTIELAVGDPAPAFALPGSDGSTHQLVDYRGRVVVLAWFPKAFTGG
jgi:peroxiredoxin Q/BCP